LQYFADTFAIIDYVDGKEVYKKYFIKHSIVTTKLNLLELYYHTLQISEQKAEEYYNLFLGKTVEIMDEHIKNAAKFRFKYRKNSISYIDAVGYEVAKSMKIKFLTGDKEFKEMPNVEFVK